MKRVIVFFTLILLLCVVTSIGVAGTNGSTATSRSGDAMVTARTSGGHVVEDSQSRVVRESLWRFFRGHLMLRLPGLWITMIERPSAGNDGPIKVQTPPGTVRKVSIRPEKDDHDWEEKKN